MIRRHEQPTADSPILPARHLHLSAGRAAGSAGRRRAHPAAHPPRGKPPARASGQRAEPGGAGAAAAAHVRTAGHSHDDRPGHNEVRSMRGIAVEFAEQPGLCRKTRPPLPPPFAAVWRSARKSPGVCSMCTICWAGYEQPAPRRDRPAFTAMRGFIAEPAPSKNPFLPLDPHAASAPTIPAVRNEKETSMLLKVGELARRSGVTVRTLHHYDNLICSNRPHAPMPVIGSTTARTSSACITSLRGLACR